MTSGRSERWSGHRSEAGGRTDSQRDRDRVLYSKAFRRLNGVSQVVSAAEGATYHNRMVHSLKVAQIGRRLAESLLRWYPELIVDVDPDVVETAALAHDLGHPPFGHIGERTLFRLAQDKELVDGYEGNAQNLRILSDLEVTGYPHGLDLTRATLQAVIKYPWFSSDPRASKKGDLKFACYDTEKPLFEWLGKPTISGLQSIECQIMEWADDVSYALHDLTDFYRIGLIPLEHFADLESQEATSFADSVQVEKGISKNTTLGIIESFISKRSINSPYQGTVAQRENLYKFINNSINNMLSQRVFEVKQDADRYFVKINEEMQQCVKVLKYFTVYYVINSYSLNSIQVGQEKCIELLVSTFCNALNDKNMSLIPNLYRDKIRSVEDPFVRTRYIFDLVSGLTDQQASVLFCRFAGTQLGSIRNPII